MSDLNKQISEWRVTMEERIGRKATDELEDHLQTILESLATSGLPEHERLLVATHRLGHPDALSMEYAKNHPLGIWRERAIWMLVGWTLLPVYISLFRPWAIIIAMHTLAWGLPNSASVALALVLIGMIFVSPVVLCLWVGNDSTSFRWSPSKWLPKSFGKLAILMLLAVFGAQATSFLVVNSPLNIGTAQVGEETFFAFLNPLQMWAETSQLFFPLASAIVIAWLLSLQRPEADAILAQAGHSPNMSGRVD